MSRPDAARRALPAWAYGAGIFATALLVYLPATRNGFVWDDPLVLEQLRAIQSLRDLFVLPAAIPRYYFRPLIFVSFLIDRAVGGVAPFWFHLSLVLAHAATSMAVWGLGVRLLADPIAAALGALIFALHPIHVESVAWIAGRSDVLATLFLVASAWRLADRRAAWSAPAAVIAFGLALLCKEIALAGVLLLPLIDRVRDRPVRWRVAAGIWATAAAYLVLRRAVLGAAISGYAGTSSGADLVRQLIAAVGFYSVKFVWPMPQSAYIPEVPQNGLTLGIGALAVAGVVIAAVRTWRRGSRVTAWLLAWCAATLAPSLMVIVRVSAQAPVAERYLYPPSVGACLLVGWLATRSVRARGPLMIGVGALCLWFAVASMVRNRVWSDALLFWQDVAAKAPDHALGHRELAQIYLNRNQIPEAEAAISRALQAKSDRDGRVMTLNNAGTIYLRQQRLDDAERVFSEGLALYPHGYLYYGLGRIAVSRAELAQRRGDSQETRRQVLLARDYLLQAVQAEPDGAKAHALLGQVFFNLRDLPAARRHLQQALDLGATGSVAAGARTYLKMAGDGIEADAPGR